ncbi:hypothetical protein B0H16DRAFT_1681804 [Mycena metata]|uniref:Uncharacterized protein n=1 Tax=Mycena metata TaxID=1033252 RepID=A0AAD7P1T1_9AGAR|nr:hypothetical protein B0H16DRAFT_1681804 [Mycena metata]
MAWDCGVLSEACAAKSEFQATLAGGMGNAYAFFCGKYVPITHIFSPKLVSVAYNPPTNSVIVSHESTDAVKFYVLPGTGSLNSTLFPGAPDGLPASATSMPSPPMKSARGAALDLDQKRETSNSRKDTFLFPVAPKYRPSSSQIGHSLGGALAELDALSLWLICDLTALMPGHARNSIHGVLCKLDSSLGVNAVAFGTPRGHR